MAHPEGATGGPQGAGGNAVIPGRKDQLCGTGTEVAAGAPASAPARICDQPGWRLSSGNVSREAGGGTGGIGGVAAGEVLPCNPGSQPRPCSQPVAARSPTSSRRSASRSCSRANACASRPPGGRTAPQTADRASERSFRSSSPSRRSLSICALSSARFCRNWLLTRTVSGIVVASLVSRQRSGQATPGAVWASSSAGDSLALPRQLLVRRPAGPPRGLTSAPAARSPAAALSAPEQERRLTGDHPGVSGASRTSSAAGCVSWPSAWPPGDCGTLAHASGGSFVGASPNPACRKSSEWSHSASRSVRCEMKLATCSRGSPLARALRTH
mmetsp:Transcript_42260/g.134215  ORF Transcript_42260/g.134215 Transcript_42260/m.134215 type:complete len:328 (+) Transcript_42260:391-1374(+)